MSRDRAKWDFVTFVVKSFAQQFEIRNVRCLILDVAGS